MIQGSLLLFIMYGASVAVPNTLVQKEGQNVKVNCSVGPGEPRYDFKLLVNGTDIALTGKYISSERTVTGTLYVYGPVTRLDNDVDLVCKRIGFNTIFSVPATKPKPTHVLHVAWLDNITLSQSNVTVKVGDNVVVNMTYEANPLPMIRVTKSGTIVSGVDQLTTRQFTFNNVEEADSGIYDIEAVNFAGSAQAVFILTVTKNGDDYTVAIYGSVSLMVSVVGIGAICGGICYCLKKCKDEEDD